MLTFTALHCTVNRLTPLNYNLLHYTVLNCTILYCIALNFTALHCTGLHYTALHCTVLHWTRMNSTALHCTVLHWTRMNSTALHCTALLSNGLDQYVWAYKPITWGTRSADNQGEALWLRIKGIGECLIFGGFVDLVIFSIIGNL